MTSGANRTSHSRDPISHGHPTHHIFFVTILSRLYHHRRTGIGTGPAPDRGGRPAQRRNFPIPVHHARASVGRLPRGHLPLIPDYGHLPHLERPERFVAALGRFLAEQGGHRHHVGETGSVGATGGGGKEVDDGLSTPTRGQAPDRARLTETVPDELAYQPYTFAA